MNTVIFVRHGETDANKALRLLGNEDPSLNASGIDESRRCAEWIAAFAGSPTLVLSSPKKRAEETAAIIAARCGTSASSDARLVERHLGKYDNLDRPNLVAQRTREGHRFRDITQDWLDVSGVEQDEEVAARALATANLDPQLDQRLVLVTHAGVIKSVFHSVLAIAPERRGILKIRNGGALALVFRADGIALEALFNPAALPR